MTEANQEQALASALRQLLEPLARLALGHGLTYAAVDQLLRQALVEEACRLQPEGPRHGRVSRVSVATGLTRREVGRLLEIASTGRPVARSHSGELFARWLADPVYCTRGRPRVLPRHGDAPSFEALAHSVTSDVHPRALLDELCRLELAVWDREADTVALQRRAFVPSADRVQMLGLLADNVGDHLQAAVDNVLHGPDAHFEQAVFADELSAESVQALRPLIAAQWAALLRRLAPELERRIADDRARGRVPDRRVRIGFYSFSATTGEQDPSGPEHDLHPDSPKSNRGTT